MMAVGSDRCNSFIRNGCWLLFILQLYHRWWLVVVVTTVFSVVVGSGRCNTFLFGWWISVLQFQILSDAAVWCVCFNFSQ